jgi:hypothetical protein
METPYAVSPKDKTAGTGFFIDARGHILTCAHVLGEATEVMVEIPSEGERQFKATVLGICPVFDLGLLRIEGYITREWCTLNEADKLHVQSGDTIAVVGFPLLGSHLKQTTGVITGQQMNKYQTNASIHSGNSGGPMFSNGVVIGVCSNSPDPSDFEGAIIGYAVPIQRFFVVAKALYSPRRVVHFPKTFGFDYQPTSAECLAYIGYQPPMSDAEPAPNGVLVTKVHPNGLVHRTGLRRGDVVCKIGGQSVDSVGNLACTWMKQRMTFDDFLFTLPLRRKVPLEYWSAKTHTTVCTSVTIRELPQAVRICFPTFEPMDYEVVAGMVVMPLTLNHVAEDWAACAYGTEFTPTIDPPEFTQYADEDHSQQPRVVISAVLLTSYVSSLRLFPERGTHVLQTVNQRPVTTMASFRDALAHPVVRHKRKYLEIQTNQVSALCAASGRVETRHGGNEGGTMVVVPLDVAAKEEPRLRKMHQYPPSSVSRG